MEKVKIDVYISDLLYSYDCVIIPQFGGFVANYTSAKLNRFQHKFEPPSKKISFNQQLKNDDGLLTNHIAGKKEITYAQAKELVHEFARLSNKGLQEGDRIKIEKVGTLFLDSERTIQFIAEHKTNYLLDSFGLDSFRALPIEKTPLEERIVEKIKKQELVKPKEKVSSTGEKKVNWMRAAAVLTVLLLSAFILNLQFKVVDSNGINYSAFRLNLSEESLYQPNAIDVKASFIEEEVEVKAHLFPENSISRFVTSNHEETELFVDNRAEDIEIKKDNTLVKSNSVSKSLGMNYHVIGGCFSQKANANKLLNRLTQEGYDAIFLGPYKKYQAVSIGSFNNREKALELLREVRQREHPNAWLLVKPY